MWRPDLRRTEPQTVEVHHALDMGALFVGEVVHVILRSDQPLFLARESDENQRMMTRLRAQAVQQARQQRRSCPVVDYAVAKAVDLIGMRTDYDDLPRSTRQHANNVRWKLPVERLLGEICLLASGLRQPLPDQRFAFAVLG